MDDDDLKRLLDANAAEARRHFEILSEGLQETRQHFGVVTAETRRHFDIVAEGLRHQIQTVAEGVNMNGEKIERLDAKLEQISSDLDTRITRLEVASSRWPR